jgi:hypothetical protein
MTDVDRTNEAALRSQIRAEVERRMRTNAGLQWHVAVFVVVNLLLVTINFMFTPGFSWFVFPLLGWSIGLFFHVFAVKSGGQRRAALEAEVERELSRRGLSPR